MRLLTSVANGEYKLYYLLTSLDGRIHQTGDAAFTPITPQDLQHSRANNDSHNTQHTGVKNKIHFSLCKKTLSPARRVLEDTSPNLTQADAGGPSLLMGIINQNRLDCTKQAKSRSNNRKPSGAV